MIQKFRQYIESLVENPLQYRFLLAVSGGIDSMVMLDLFEKSPYHFAVANIHFKLRGEESLNEFAFVKQYCQAHQINIYQIEFDTKEFAQNHSISIQMAARQLRYQWFDSLADEYQYDFIALAHHLDDQTETFFINLLRGTGIAGLHGIASRKNKILRPLMFVNRLAIADYAHENEIDFLEDSSNASDKYQRNYIRHQLVPIFKKLRPDFSETLNTTLGFLSDMEKIALQQINSELTRLIQKSVYGIFQMQIHGLIKHDTPALLLYYGLRDYGFEQNHIHNILFLIAGNGSGKRVQTAKYEVIIDRDAIILRERIFDELESETIMLNSLEDVSWASSKIRLAFPYSGDFKSSNPNFAFLDFDKIQFPLTIRAWKPGDDFRPFGMRGRKKVSDYLIDCKRSMPQKEKTKVLCQGEQIVWLIGERIDQNFAIQINTNNILKLEFYGDN